MSGREAIVRRLRRLEARVRPALRLEITPAVRAQSALELAAWRAEQEARIDAARHADPHTFVGAPSGGGR
jgi:hypothetical protein